MVASVQAAGSLIELAHSGHLSSAIGLLDPEMAAASILTTSSSAICGGTSPGYMSRSPLLQRMGPPVFSSLVELSGAGWASGIKVHNNLDRSVEELLVASSAISTGLMNPTATAVKCRRYDTSRSLTPCGSKILVEIYVDHGPSF